MERIIFHIDVNSAFLSWEAVYRLQILGEETDLREIPSVVGGDEKKRHGIVLAKSIPAKRYGIQTGESLAEARKKCPNLVIVPPQHDLYKQCSESFIALLREYTPCVEQYSIDEAYMDMTGTLTLHGSPVVVANFIKDRIYEEMGFTVNIGISNNKLLAKMASDFKKPNLVHTLFPDEIAKKMWPLPVSELFFVGRATAKKLFSMGIKSIGDLAKADVEILKTNLKKHGEVIHNFANGIDDSLVLTESIANKGYGNSTTIPFDVTDNETARLILLSLSETVGARLRKDQVFIRVVAVSIVDCEFHHVSHQMTLLEPTNLTNEIHQAACKLLEELWNGEPLRNFGIHTSRIEEQGETRQLSLFELGLHKESDRVCEQMDYRIMDDERKMLKREKLEKLDQTIDQIRTRYGMDSIKRANFVNSRLSHMSGGTSSITLPKQQEKGKPFDPARGLQLREGERGEK
ncbi:DNA polymerase Y family protein [Anaerosporobacter faecicola]|uniref:DNA polymerase Y family protein n=1 Tax=Anaerosporobacter faecicola TaxID=2718714 RepID=UPI00143A7BF9|nr:DNA polymerase IV [Anaerosporobacter faecicola]